MVTTYQAGKRGVLHADGDVLNIRFRGFSVPMSLAVQVLPGKRFPDLINGNRACIASSYPLQDQAPEHVPAQL
jgi:hypothetical protein